MIEIGIIAIVTLAVGYWVTLWLMGRHDDVLHGDFVHPDQEGASAFPVSVFPPKPTLAKPTMTKPLVGHSGMPPVQTPTPKQVLGSQGHPAPPPLSERSDTLQSLLASIKRDLKDASQL